MRLRLLTRRENDKVRFADDPPAIEQSRGRSPDSDTGPHNWYMLPTRFIFLLAIVCAALQLGGAQTKRRKVSDFQFNWNGRRNVKVILEIPEPWGASGDFTRIRILVPGEQQFAAKNDEGWVKFRSEVASTSPDVRRYKNLVPSEYVLAEKASEQGRTLLFLVGYSYASSPGSLDVIELPSIGPPRIVLHKNEFGIQELKDLDADGTAELVGYPCLPQEFGNGLLTYDPFNVYKLGPAPGDAATISIPLSRSYNLEHYYGWAGVACSEKIAVVLHPPGRRKPTIMSTEQAQRLTEGYR
jgi:hypothetical protein